MTWSYTGNPITGTAEEIRFIIGDTDPDEPLIQDEEIAYIMSKQPNMVMASAIAAEAIAAKFTREADKKIGDYQISASQRASGYLALAKRLKDSILGTVKYRAMPYAGGIRITDKTIDAENTDMVQSKFKRKDSDAYYGLDEYGNPWETV